MIKYVEKVGNIEYLYEGNTVEEVINLYNNLNQKKQIKGIVLKNNVNIAELEKKLQEANFY